MADEMPPQCARIPPSLSRSGFAIILVAQGLYEVISYRFTSRESEAHADARRRGFVFAGCATTFEIANPAASERDVLRKSLLINMLESAVNNARYQTSQQLFEVGKVYLGRGGLLPEEPLHLGILLTGPRERALVAGGCQIHRKWTSTT